MTDFGSGFGTLIGSTMAAGDLSAGQKAVNNISDSFSGNYAGPYNQFGQSFLAPTANAIDKVSTFAGSDPNLNYNTFMKNYTTSPGAQYAIDTANTAQENSAAARGGLLSGSNLRQLGTIDTGIANTYANQAFTNYLAGNNQQFGQLESALGNMFNAIGVGTTSTGQIAGVDTSQMGATSQIAQAQAKNDQAKGGGIGSLFSGIGSLATSF